MAVGLRRRIGSFSSTGHWTYIRKTGVDLGFSDKLVGDQEELAEYQRDFWEGQRGH